MKIRSQMHVLSLSLLFVLLGSVAMAQTSDEQEKKLREKEMKAKQEQLEKQERQMKEQQLKTIELEKAYVEQARASERARSSARVYSRSTGDEPYFIYTSGQENQSQLTIRNSYDGESDSSNGEIDVDESTTHIRCMINGKVHSGKISIEVLYPSGKVFKRLSITSSAEMSFTQSITIGDEDKNKYVGSWEYEITAEDAEGSYMLSFMTH